MGFQDISSFEIRGRREIDPERMEAQLKSHMAQLESHIMAQLEHEKAQFEHEEAHEKAQAEEMYKFNKRREEELLAKIQNLTIQIIASQPEVISVSHLYGP